MTLDVFVRTAVYSLFILCSCFGVYLQYSDTAVVISEGDLFADGLIKAENFTPFPIMGCLSCS